MTVGLKKKIKGKFGGEKKAFLLNMTWEKNVTKMLRVVKVGHFYKVRQN